MDKNNLKICSSMKKDGPGIWFSMHIMALFAKDIITAKAAVYILYKIIERIRGKDCRKQAKEYIIRYPPDFKNLFKWTVTFHNSVNKRLDKKIYTIREAEKLYYNTVVFTECKV